MHQRASHISNAMHDIFLKLNKYFNYLRYLGIVSCALLMSDHYTLYRTKNEKMNNMLYHTDVQLFRTFISSCILFPNLEMAREIILLKEINGIYFLLPGL